MNNWVVVIHGNLNVGWEISLCRKEYTHGMKSCGWFGEDKILIGEPNCSNLSNTRAMEILFREQCLLAIKVKDMLNNK